MAEKISDAALKAKREYFRAWRAANKDRTREYQKRYWEKKAKKEVKKSAENETDRKIQSQSAAH